MDAKAKHADFCRQADEAFANNDIEKGKEFTAKAQSLNPEIESYQALMEQEYKFAGEAPGAAVDKDAIEKAKERAEALKKGQLVTYTTEEVMKGLGFHKSLLLSEESLVMPTRTSPTVRDGENPVSSILDQVSVMDLTGAQSYAVPILMKDLEAHTGDPFTLTGTKRQDSDAEFDSAEINPYEVNVTSYVDRNLYRLTNVDYEGIIRTSAMRALRRKVAELIYNGGGTKMLGIKGGKTVGGVNLVKTITVSEIAPGFLDDVVFSYGGDEETGGQARLFLNKKDLQAIGKLRYEDGKRVYSIVPDAGNPNTGRIIEGGLIVPYTIGSALTDYAAAGTSAISMVYGDPINYLLGLFGPYSIRVDESYMAAERMNTILGDAFVGGNIVAPGGFIGVTKGV
jgi:HK97 family phage major capsid protein